MAWAQGTSIVSVAEFGQFVGGRDLANFDRDGDTTLADVLARASDAIYAHIRSSRNGIDPNTIANVYAFQPAVARHAHATLVISGALSLPEGREAPLTPWEWSKPELAEVSVETASQPKPKRVTRPRAKNLRTRRGHF